MTKPGYIRSDAERAHDRDYNIKHGRAARQQRREAALQTPEGKAAWRAAEAEVNASHRAKKRALVLAAKAHGCVDCGRTDLPPEVIDLDHVRGVKSFSLGAAARYSLPAVVAEIAKCDPRCPTCHALRHYRERVSEYGRFT